MDILIGNMYAHSTQATTKKRNKKKYKKRNRIGIGELIKIMLYSYLNLMRFLLSGGHTFFTRMARNCYRLLLACRWCWSNLMDLKRFCREVILFDDLTALQIEDFNWKLMEIFAFQSPHVVVLFPYSPLGSVRLLEDPIRDRESYYLILKTNLFLSSSLYLTLFYPFPPLSSSSPFVSPNPTFHMIPMNF